MESINFIVQRTGMKHPDNRTIIQLSFKTAFIKMRLLGNSI